MGKKYFSLETIYLLTPIVISLGIMNEINGRLVAQVRLILYL